MLNPVCHVYILVHAQSPVCDVYMLNPVCGVYIHIHAQPFHLCCLQECQAPFGTGSFYDHDGLPYCETHYHAKKGSLCAR